MSNYNTILIIVGLILTIMYFTNKYGSPINYKIPENRKFPFRYLQDENNNILPIVAITSFFRDDFSKELYYKYIKNGIKAIGITAYKSFPKPILHDSEDKYHLTDDFNYLKNIKNWLCCFNKKKEYGFTDEHNIIDMSESDWYDIDTEPVQEKKYDFIYICNKDDDKCSLDGWNAINRNFELALKCFPIMFNKYKLKGLIIGRVHCGLEQIYGDQIEVTDFLPWDELQEKMKQSKFLFVPNIHDASPRVVSECLIKNVPVLMNKNILCGSKYINDETGVLFESENDIDKSLETIISKLDKFDVKTWWQQNYGRDNSAIKLRNYLYDIYPEKLKDVNKVFFVL